MAVYDLDNVRVRERLQVLRLSEDHIYASRGGYLVGLDDLDGHLLVGDLVEAQRDRAEAALAQNPDDLVLAEVEVVIELLALADVDPVPVFQVRKVLIEQLNGVDAIHAYIFAPVAPPDPVDCLENVDLGDGFVVLEFVDILGVAVLDQVQHLLLGVALLLGLQQVEH